MFRFLCPSCDEPYDANEEAVGHKFACEKCAQRIQVPPPDIPSPNKAVLGKLPDQVDSAAFVEATASGARIRKAVRSNPSSRASIPQAVSGQPKLAPEGAGQQSFFIRDLDGKVRGPFTIDVLQKLARQGRIQPSWQVSPDQQKWVAAAKLENIFPDLEDAITSHLTPGGGTRSLTKQEQIALFIDKFVLNNDNLKDSLPWLKSLRVWWAKLTLPSKGFVMVEVTASGTRYVRHEFGAEKEIEEKDLDKTVSEGIKKFNWFNALFAVVGLVWLMWTFKDFLVNFSFTWGTLKTVLLAIVAVAVFIYKTKQMKVFVGYELDPAATKKLNGIKGAFLALRKSKRVWMYEVKAAEDQSDWKYNAGSSFTVAKLPAAIFNRPIPNVDTNIAVVGITFREKALYFLPEKILLIDDGAVENSQYDELKISTEALDYVELEGKTYPDSVILGHKWKYINKDGSRDKRFKDNYEIPEVRCGILRFGLGGTRFSLMTTNPEVPKSFKAKFQEAAKDRD